MSDEEGSLPKGLWALTAVFAVVAAAALVFMLRMGRQSFEAGSRATIEGKALEPEDGIVRGDSEEAPREALPGQTEGAGLAAKHWQMGLIHYSNGAPDKAQADWLLCLQYEPDNGDCRGGLERVEKVRSSERLRAGAGGRR